MRPRRFHPSFPFIHMKHFLSLLSAGAIALLLAANGAMAGPPPPVELEYSSLNIVLGERVRVQITSDLAMFATYPLVVQLPNGTYNREGSSSSVNAPDWTVSQQSGQVTVNSTYAPGYNVGPNDPNCVAGRSSGSTSGWSLLPDSVGSYKYELWAIYAYGEGGYQYREGKVCINQPFTYEIIKITSLQVTVSPNTSASHIPSLNPPNATSISPWSIAIVSSTDIQPSATGQPFNAGSTMRPIPSLETISALLFTFSTLALTTL
ncbi:hypothetical protein CPB86DRAFT_632313 [Serendipita vermifera]|nr:hypothetical protein CPB86DRAFT_632313 [Serendipita vermifera]